MLVCIRPGRTIGLVLVREIGAVGVVIVETSYTKDGEPRKGTGLRNNGAYFDPADLDGSRTPVGEMAATRATASAESGSSGELDDEIPF